MGASPQGTTTQEDHVQPSASDIEGIRQVLYRYCRGLDRMDRALVEGCFAPRATVDYRSIFAGSAIDFVEEVWARHAAHLRHSHQITNVLVEEVAGELVSEAYVTVTLWSQDDQGLVERVVRGRYLDRWTGHGGWQIRERTFVADHRTEHRLSDDALGAMLGHATRDDHDPSFQLFGPSRAIWGTVGDDPEDAVADIQQLKARYLQALDQNRWDEMEALLTEDVTVSYASGAHHHVGRTAVLTFLRQTTLARPTVGSSHVAANPIIELQTPDRATGTWRLTDLVHDRDRGSLLIGAGIYRDEYQRTEDGWRIAATGYERLLEVRLPA